jgi:hypothetical protein
VTNLSTSTNLLTGGGGRLRGEEGKLETSREKADETRQCQTEAKAL